MPVAGHRARDRARQPVRRSLGVPLWYAPTTCVNARHRYTIQSDATVQSSALVWLGTGPLAPGGMNCETTSWILRPPLAITNRMFITPVEPVGTGAFKLITMLPVRSDLTV